MSACKYRPLFGRVIIRREVTAKTGGGIIIPETVAKRHAKCSGVVVAIGPSAEGVREGDKVLFGKHAGAWLDATFTDKGEEKDDGTLFICQDEDILAVENDERNAA